MTTTKLITADELLLMPRDDYHYELVRGVLTEPLPPHFDPHGKAVASFGFILSKYADDNDYGTITGRAGFHLEANPDMVRAPDIGWVAPGRITERVTGYLRLSPDLAVEIRESYETQEDMNERAAMWLDFGTRMVWVADPAPPVSITRYRPGQEPRILGEDDTLDGGDLLPGFSIPVWRLFRRHR